MSPRVFTRFREVAVAGRHTEARGHDRGRGQISRSLTPRSARCDDDLGGADRSATIADRMRYEKP